MVNALLVVHIVLAICMIALVLFQKSEGGALGMGGGSGGGGMGGFMSARGTANLLTRATGILATLFFLTTLGLAVLFKGGATQKSILEDVAPIQKTAETSEGTPASDSGNSAQKDASGMAATTKTSGATDSLDPALVNAGQKEKTRSSKTSS